MKTLSLVLSTTLLGAFASAAAVDPRNETQTIECGELLVMKSVNRGAAVQESKSYNLLIILKPRKIVITSKVDSKYSAVCKDSNRL